MEMNEIQTAVGINTISYCLRWMQELSEQLSILSQTYKNKISAQPDDGCDL